jgi:hypothetical protein
MDLEQWLARLPPPPAIADARAIARSEEAQLRAAAGDSSNSSMAAYTPARAARRVAATVVAAGGVEAAHSFMQRLHAQPLHAALYASMARAPGGRLCYSSYPHCRWGRAVRCRWCETRAARCRWGRAVRYRRGRAFRWSCAFRCRSRPRRPADILLHSLAPRRGHHDSD